MKLLSRTLYVVAIVLFTFIVALVVNDLSIPNHNTDATHFDTLVVLGCPTNPDGTPSPEQRERVLEAVREFKSGVAPHVIMTGGAAHNAFTEAHSMAQLAIANGVPSAAIVEEDHANNTIQNLVYSAQIMRRNNWGTAEIVSSPSHLPRTAILADALNRQKPDLSFNWRTHAAQWPKEYPLSRELRLYYNESLYSLKLRFNPPTVKAPAIT
ncbi:hypothetical protein BH10ACI4_BH10ACI4_22640 [soil metagenome]